MRFWHGGVEGSAEVITSATVKYRGDSIHLTPGTQINTDPPGEPMRMGRFEYALSVPDPDKLEKIILQGQTVFDRREIIVFR